MLTTLLLSFGVPLLLGGDEFGRTQQGNNNAYCQDNDISWFDWSDVDADLLEYTKQLIALRLRHPVFRRRRFLSGSEASHLRWFTPAGIQMTGADWADPAPGQSPSISTATTIPTGPRTVHRSSTTTFSCWSTRGGNRCGSPCLSRVPLPVGNPRSTATSRP